MDDRKDNEKTILMGVEPYEAKEGATADLYRPLTKEQLTHLVQQKGFWLFFLIFFTLVGIVIQILRS
jgi:hypothetical protein